MDNRAPIYGCPDMLPPLKSLIAFEAASRLTSFTAAAKELHVTQGAISRQIALLEESLGLRLFKRINRKTKLTSAGEQYAGDVRRILFELRTATRSVVEVDTRRPLTLVTTNAFASLCLMPKMEEIQTLVGHDAVRLIARDDISSLSEMPFDCAVFYSRNEPQGLTSEALFDEQVSVVCSPSFRQKHGELDDVELIGTRQLWCESVEDWVQWPAWQTHFGLAIDPTCQRMDINNYPMVLQTALSGQGVALAWRGLTDDYTDSGDLVRVTNYEWSTGSSFYLIQSQQPEAEKCSDRSMQRDKLLDWLRLTFQNNKR